MYLETQQISLPVFWVWICRAMLVVSGRIETLSSGEGAPDCFHSCWQTQDSNLAFVRTEEDWPFGSQRKLDSLPSYGRFGQHNIDANLSLSNESVWLECILRFPMRSFISKGRPFQSPVKECRAKTNRVCPGCWHHCPLPAQSTIGSHWEHPAVTLTILLWL